MAKLKKSGGSNLVPAADKEVIEETLRSFGKRNMLTYSEAVNLDRAVPDLFDGLKPVHRRILWAASHFPPFQLVKAARCVGDVIGKYHPHGDNSVYSAMVTLVHSPTPTVYGEGNWGSLIDSAAAYRYTNSRLTNYGLSFFDPFYINKEVTSFVSNFDDTEVEPVTLPAQLPNVLLNGGEGIGVAITTYIPTFTPESMIEILTRLLKKEKLTTKDFASTLKFAHKYGGRLVSSKENKKAWLNLFSSVESNVKFESDLDVDEDRKRIIISDWAPGTSGSFIEKFIAKVRAMPEVARCDNSKGSLEYTIDCRKDYNLTQFQKLVERVRSATVQSCAFKINVTQREASVVDGVTSYTTKFLSLTVPELIVQWLKMRIELELKSLTFRIKKQQEAIDYSKLLIYACDHLDAGFKALKSKDPIQTLMKLLKITEEQSTILVNLKFIQWSRLDQEKLKLKLKEQEAHMRQLQKWQAKPRSKILLDMENMKTLIEKDRNVKVKSDNQQLTIV